MSNEVKIKDAICPACGSGNIVKKQIAGELKDLFNTRQTYMKVQFNCKDCNTIGDFFNENDEAEQEALCNLNFDLLNKIVAKLKKLGISPTKIEAAFNLSYGSINDWVSGKCHPTKEGMALLKVIVLFPWIHELFEDGCASIYGYQKFMDMMTSDLVGLI